MSSRTRTVTVLALGLAALGASACADMGMNARPRVVSSRCSDERFPIYFAQGSDQLTPIAQQVIASHSRRVSGCKITAVDVLGLADADGPAEQNLELSRRRATNVASALAQAGLPAPAFDVQAAGDAGATSPKGNTVPMRRRTEVVLHAAPAA